MSLARSLVPIASLVRPAARAAALGSLLALGVCATTAQAVPVLSAAANIVVPVSSAGIYINVVTGASGAAAATTGWDINPWGSGSPFIWSASTGGIAVSGSPATPTALAAGAVVGSSLTYTASGNASTFPANTTTYFGFSFVNEADGLLHYGYGSMVVGATTMTRTVGQLWYESVAGASITIPAVPEPSGLAMMLAGGAVGALVLRRRRQDDRG